MGKTKHKQYQIDGSLLYDLVLYFDDTFGHAGDPELYERCKQGILSKMDAIAKHELYSTYKNKTLTPAEREQARIDYLDTVGMRECYRWHNQT